VIELDGEDHFWEEGMQSDTNKTNYISELGIAVIRFENQWIFEDINFVLNKIRESFRQFV